ncbi:MAG: hypothetical protein V4858_18190 [Pseudomonadota bacterium]
MDSLQPPAANPSRSFEVFRDFASPLGRTGEHVGIDNDEVFSLDGEVSQLLQANSSLSRKGYKMESSIIGSIQRAAPIDVNHVARMPEVGRKQQVTFRKVFLLINQGFISAIKLSLTTQKGSVLVL